MATNVSAASTDPCLARRLCLAARAAGGLAVGVGAAVLAGWALATPLLQGLLPDWAAMQPGTALGLIMAGLGLDFAQRGRPQRRAGLACAVAATLLGLASLLAYGLGRAPVGLPPVLTAAGLALLGPPIAALARGRLPRPARITAAAAFLLALTEAVGYLFSATSLDGRPLHIHIEPHTALTMIVLALGVLAARPTDDVLRLLISSGAGRAIGRQLLPPVVLVPIAVGWLPRVGRAPGGLPPLLVAAGLALLVLLAVAVCVTLSMRNAAALARADAARQQEHSALAAQVQDYRTLLDQASDAIFIADPGGNYLTVNVAACQLLGYSAPELLGLNMRDVLDPADAGRTPLRLDALRDGKSVLSERSLRRKDGTLIPVEISSKMLDDGRLQGIARDISERLRTQQTQAFLAAIVQSSEDAILGAYLDTTILSWNDGAERLFGYTAAEAIGQSVTMLAPPERAGELRGLLDRVGQGERLVQYETTRLHKDGSLVELALSMSPIRDASGTIVAAAAIAHAIGARKLLAAQLRQAQKMEVVGRLAGGIAHDFNNILMAITGYVELALEDMPHETPVANDLQEALHAARRAAGLTQQLLAFARQQVIEPYVLDLNALIIDMDRLLRRLIGEDIDLETRPAGDLWSVRADPAQLQQVIVNLAVNARDAMPSGGRLTIETDNVVLDREYTQLHLGVTPGCYVMLAISDTGTGMDEAVRQRLFEPFFTTKEQGKGTGLGLATCYGIVKQHGGNIWVYSELGHGTTFKVYLPAVEAALDAPTHLALAPHAEQVLARGTESVLVVEDEPAVRAITSRVLRNYGYQVLEAVNGAEALALARARGGAGIDLLLTDVVMPQMGGSLLAEQLTAIYPHIRVLFVSGYAANAVVHHGRLGPHVRFLQKPVSPSALLRKVREALDA